MENLKINIELNGKSISSLDSYEKGGATYKKGDFFQRRWLLSDYGYMGKKGTEIKVTKEGDIILGEPIGVKLTDFQKSRLPFEYEIEDTSVLPVYEHTNPITNYAKGGITKNEQIIEQFLTENTNNELKNISIHYSTLGDVMLLRNYGTLIAKRKGKKVWVSSKKYSSTTSTIQNAIKRLAEEMGMKVNMITPEQFADGGSVSNADAPRIYVADLKAYNEGKLIGEWLDLTDYNDGDEVNDKIIELTEGWSEEHHNGDETEHAIHDFENIDNSLGSEYMGISDYDMIINSYNVSENTGIPAEVIQNVASQYDIDGSDLEDWVSDNYSGQFDSDEDLGYDYVENMGGVSELGDNTIETYFDYNSFGRDLAYDYNEVDGHYFRNYAKGGKVYDLEKYMKGGISKDSFSMMDKKRGFAKGGSINMNKQLKFKI